MQKELFAGVLCLSASFLLAAEDFKPLNVKTGLWETTTTMKSTGEVGIPPDMAAQMSPEQRARYEAAIKKTNDGTPRTHKECLTKEKLTRNPFSGRSDAKCTVTVIKSSGSNFEAQEVCADEGSKRDSHISVQTIDSEHVKGSVQSTVTTNGRTMNINGSLESKWLGSSCPAGVR